ncbi:MAG: hypothetical protein U5M51_14700 [Emticicia sp.]|nr:hypothetical protein [Emticicia sp.]
MLKNLEIPLPPLATQNTLPKFSTKPMPYANKTANYWHTTMSCCKVHSLSFSGDTSKNPKG